ncbi:hypothetical protein [Neorhizobium galegae]|uniref:Uncharacterized protein n=1 Tax=Neorhizobium galegae bv. orientalis str. HAMBI 540 TaxID=1028800 RepID=A0A068SQP3_NEOGA|nr:hypothetical protein [Neorhizobium galegae]CDN48086.1 Hypothetical protein RG540_CH19170 [Neorhizobium galegae bv. orientalis str. HAMBI 540]CDZ46552.1 Hypothetical protein NGAL_HAMBI2427_17370 [Neorhizobium galegae bv. orientalis]
MASRRRFGRRGVAAAGSEPSAPAAVSARVSERFAQAGDEGRSFRISWKQIRHGLWIAALVFLVVGKVFFAFRDDQVRKQATEADRLACASQRMSFARSAYVNCLMRVAAGGKP